MNPWIHGILCAAVLLMASALIFWTVVPFSQDREAVGRVVSGVMRPMTSQDSSTVITGTERSRLPTVYPQSKPGIRTAARAQHRGGVLGGRRSRKRGKQ